MAVLVKLRDGREVPNDSEEWRHECEARSICKKPTLEARRAQLDRVEKHRGTAARKALEAEIRAIWDSEIRPRLAGAA